MQRGWSARVILFAALLTSVCMAQEAVPGTFSTGPVQPYGGLILTTPSMSLGNGITPPVVSNQAPVYVTVPQQPVRSVALAAWAAGAGLAEGGPVESARPTRVHANLIYPSGISLSEVTASALSLGEAARMLRMESRPPAKRVYTNDDVARLISQEQPAQGTQTPQQAKPAQKQQQRPHQYTVPIGSAPPPDVVPSQPAQAQTPPPHRSGNPFEPKVREEAPSQGEQRMANPTYPKTASSLPLIGLLGGTLLALGLICRRLYA